MIQSSASRNDMAHLGPALKLSKGYFCTHHLVHLPDPSTLVARNSLTDISNTVHRSPVIAPVNNVFVDDLSSRLPRSHPTFHLGRVASVDYHDLDAWAPELEVHDTKLNAVTASSSLGSSGAMPDDCSPVGVTKNSFASMELRSQGPRTVEQFPTWFQEDAVACPHEWTSLVTLGPGTSPVRPNVIVGPCPREDLSEGRRRVGEILVRCGVINIPRVLPVESTVVGCGGISGSHPVNEPVLRGLTPKLPLGENDRLLITALADWTSEWVHTLVIQPYLEGGFRFQYQEKPSKVSTSTVLRIRRVLSDVYNPVQVAIHALWFIGILTGGGAHDNTSPVPSFLSVPIFRYLHNNGTFIAEDFMFRIFITCAMIGDKSVNDVTLSTNTWNRLTHIPQVILRATERYTLFCLRWNVVMTRVQWQDTIVYLRSCVKMGSAFDPFAYDETSPPCVMACYLDELINLNYADDTYTSQQGVPAVEILAPRPIQPFMDRGVFDAAEWCPKDDPVVNRKPKTIGIAPGADQNSSTQRVGTTAMDLLESILASSNVPELAHLARPTGASLRGSFGAIGSRLAHTVKITAACQSTPWFPSHG